MRKVIVIILGTDRGKGASLQRSGADMVDNGE